MHGVSNHDIMTTHVLTIDLRDIELLLPPSDIDYFQGLVFAVGNSTQACWTMWVDDIIARQDFTQRQRVDYLSSLVNPSLRRWHAGRVLSLYEHAGEIEYGAAGVGKKLDVTLSVIGMEHRPTKRIALPNDKITPAYPEASYKIIGAPNGVEGIRLLETIVSDLYPLFVQAVARVYGINVRDIKLITCQTTTLPLTLPR